MKPLLMQFISKLDIQPVSVLPIVLVVMTPAEATELETGAAFDNDTQALRSYFDQEIRPKVSGIAGWRSRYQEQPADWRPFGGGPDRSLRKTIEGAIGDWLQRTPRAERLRAKYLDIRTINAPANREQLNQLRLDGCLIVIDHVSLCHPRLFNEYRRSLLDVFPQTVLLKLAPFDHVPIEEFEVAVPFKQRFDSFFFERMTLDNDLRNNGVAGSELYLRQWLSQHFVNRGNSQQSAGGIRASWNT
jgi:hypothetical protein